MLSNNFAKVLVKILADNFINGILWINDCIERTPTIIEAEGNINE